MGTWRDVKLKTLQKMFATNNGSTNIPSDNNTREYLSAMPGAANEALQMLATAGKFIIKSIDIAHIPVRNLISQGDKIRTIEAGSLSFEAEYTKSIYYEVLGKGTVTIKVGEEETTEEFDSSADGSKGFMPVKKLITNPDNLKVVLTLTSDYPLSAKNVALYSANYSSADDIPPFSMNIRYNLSELVDDYYMVDLEHVIYEGDADISRYKATSDFFQEGFKVLVLPRDIPGNYKVYYKAYPQSITLDTPDDEVLSLDPEVEALLPLYMASQLYKDDDSGIATVYRNEFEVAFERLKDSVSAPSSERFTSESGWI
jgi:hypothetical protein